MDDRRFDDWTRSLVAMASRRTAAKVVAGAALAHAGRAPSAAPPAPGG